MHRTFPAVVLTMAIATLLLASTAAHAASNNAVSLRQTTLPRTMDGWWWKSGSSSTQQRLVVDNGIVYSANSSYIFAVYGNNGTMVWMQNFTNVYPSKGTYDSNTLYTFAVRRGFVLFHTQKQFVALNVDDGTVAWRSYPETSGTTTRWRYFTAIIRDDTLAYIVDYNDNVYNVWLDTGKNAVIYRSNSSINNQPLETTVPVWGIVLVYSDVLTLVNASGLVATTGSLSGYVSGGAVFEGMYYAYTGSTCRVFFTNNMTLFGKITPTYTGRSFKSMTFWSNDTSVYAFGLQRASWDTYVSAYDVLNKKNLYYKKYTNNDDINLMQYDSDYVWLFDSNNEFILRFNTLTGNMTQKNSSINFSSLTGKVYDGTFVTCDGSYFVVYDIDTLAVNYAADGVSSINGYGWNPVYFDGSLVYGANDGNIYTVIPINNVTLTNKNRFTYWDKANTNWYDWDYRTTTISHGDVLFFGVYRTFFAVSVRNGTVLWKTPVITSDYFSGTPYYYQGSVYANNQNTLFIYDAVTGASKVAPAGVTLPDNYREYVTYTSDEKNVYITTRFHLNKVDPKTFELTESEYTFEYSLDYGIALSDTMIFAMDSEERIRGFTKAGLGTIKKAPYKAGFQVDGTATNLVYFNKLLWTGSSASGLYCISATNSTNKPLWTFGQLDDDARYVFESDGFIHVLTDAGSIYRFRPNAKKPLAPLAVASVGKSFLGVPFIGEGVYVFANKDGVYAVDSATLKVLWSNTIAQSCSLPYAYDGKAYAQCNSRFYLYDLYTGDYWMRSDYDQDKYNVAYHKSTIFYTTAYETYYNFFRSVQIVSAEYAKATQKRSQNRFALGVNGAKPPRFGKV